MATFRSRLLILSIGLFTLPLCGTPIAAGPSFDCIKAGSPDEKAICADPQLSAIDVLVNRAYKEFEPAFGGDKKAMARALIAERRACKVDTTCIAATQYNALLTFGQVPSWVDSFTQGLIGRRALDVAAKAPKGADQKLPSAVGQCAVTHITELATRLGDDPLDTASPEAGSRATFGNGSTVVSYDREAGLAGSRVGDPAAICLVAIPRDCPPNDERGRVYYGVDLTLKGTWMLPDSQHLCGGA